MEKQKSLKSLAASLFSSARQHPSLFFFYSMSNAALFREIRLTRLVYSSLLFYYYICIIRVLFPHEEEKNKKDATPGKLSNKKKKNLLGSWFGAFLCLFLHLLFFLFSRPFLEDHPSHPRVTWIRIASLSLPTTTYYYHHLLVRVHILKNDLILFCFPFKTFTNDRQGIRKKKNFFPLYVQKKIPKFNKLLLLFFSR